ncbi:MAG: RnfABCDGE type electron transport complex subunit G, partial [Proteobacteria bacterium]|nr:RnfABCDGE type electron transport complex subunit G [Pseudomonadota bacterium]
NEEESLVYLARVLEEPVAVIFNTIAPNGYSGRIHLLVGIYFDGSLAGVRAVKHAETPGLGDAIELQKSDWMHSFEKRSLDRPGSKLWKVKRDGGVFDQFTGATITPRAVVEAVKNTLLYYQKNAKNLYD